MRSKLITFEFSSTYMPFIFIAFIKKKFVFGGGSHGEDAFEKRQGTFLVNSDGELVHVREDRLSSMMWFLDIGPMWKNSCLFLLTIFNKFLHFLRFRNLSEMLGLLFCFVFCIFVLNKKYTCKKGKLLVKRISRFFFLNFLNICAPFYYDLVTFIIILDRVDSLLKFQILYKNPIELFPINFVLGMISLVIYQIFCFLSFVEQYLMI